LVVVLGEKIRGVGAKAEIPDGAEVIDLGNPTILPGFMDAHLTMPFDFDFRQQQMDGLTKTVAEQAIDATVNARVTLMTGFTTVRDVGGPDFIDIGLRNAIAARKVPGPRMLVATNAIGATEAIATMRPGSNSDCLGVKRAFRTASRMVPIRFAWRCASTLNMART